MRHSLSLPAPPRSFDDALGREIVALHIWAVNQGLRAAATDLVFAGLCRRLVAAGVPLFRVFAGMRTLHPQWGGFGYRWDVASDTVRAELYGRGGIYERIVAESPFAGLIEAAAAAGEGAPWPSLRRRLDAGETALDSPVLRQLAAAGATDYFAQVVGFGAGDPARGTGVGYSFATARPEGFDDDNITLLQAVLPAVSLALMADAEHRIASGLLAAYLGEDAGRRVHAGAVARGSVESIRAVLWFADIRGSTAIADAAPGPDVIELLDDVFESLTGALRQRSGQVLKFLGDGMLAIFRFEESRRAETCRRALAAAAEAMRAIAALNRDRRAAGRLTAEVDIALHLGDVLYGNVGAVDRLDFTVIGPAVNEAARIEALCEPLGCNVLVSAELAAILPDAPLRSLGRHRLRGVAEPRELHALDFDRW
jgi:adenylate cyclase